MSAVPVKITHRDAAGEREREGGREEGRGRIDKCKREILPVFISISIH